VPKATDKKIIAFDLLVKANADALRRLRPEVQLAQPPGKLARRLLRDFLRLSGDMDPVRWLEEERQSETTILALALMMDYAGQLHGMVKKTIGLSTPESEIEASIRSRYQPLFGDLVTSARPVQLDKHWVEQVTDTAAVAPLLQALQQVQRLAGFPSEPSPALSHTAPNHETLLADLLRLPTSANPMQWLAETRFYLAARYVLEYLVQTSLPVNDLIEAIATGSTVRPSMTPRIKGKAQPLLSVEVKQLDFLESGFLIHLDAAYRLPRWYARLSPGEFARWDGFETISDANNHSYVTHIIERERVKRLWWWQERLTLACWPPLAKTQQLTLQASPATLSIYRPVGGSLVPLPAPALEELSISILLDP
jgi:hypothetical protein